MSAHLREIAPILKILACKIIWRLQNLLIKLQVSSPGHIEKPENLGWAIWELIVIKDGLQRVSAQLVCQDLA